MHISPSVGRSSRSSMCPSTFTWPLSVLYTYVSFFLFRTPAFGFRDRSNPVWSHPSVIPSPKTLFTSKMLWLSGGTRIWGDTNQSTPGGHFSACCGCESGSLSSECSYLDHPLLGLSCALARTWGRSSEAQVALGSPHSWPPSAQEVSSRKHL